MERSWLIRVIKIADLVSMIELTAKKREARMTANKQIDMSRQFSVYILLAEGINLKR